jgi:hypothetical protein
MVSDTSHPDFGHVQPALLMRFIHMLSMECVGRASGSEDITNQAQVAARVSVRESVRQLAPLGDEVYIIIGARY